MAIFAWQGAFPWIREVGRPGGTTADHRGQRITADDVDGLRGALLAGADLSGLDLRGRSLAGADAPGAVLRDANLAGASLRGAILRGADLRGACLDGSDLAGADLTGAQVDGATITVPAGVPMSGRPLSVGKRALSCH
jgi:uncharacterized protein YjbI with pentapeptide repeats